MEILIKDLPTMIYMRKLFWRAIYWSGYMCAYGISLIGVMHSYNQLESKDAVDFFGILLTCAILAMPSWISVGIAIGLIYLAVRG
jgi:hypothetical protein